MTVSAAHLGNLFSYAGFRGIDEAYLRSFLSDKNMDVQNPGSF